MPSLHSERSNRRVITLLSNEFLVAIIDQEMRFGVEYTD